MTVLATVHARSTSLVADASAPRNARLFTAEVLEEWGLSHLVEAACAGISELATWLVGDKAGLLLRVTVSWDEPLVFTEVADAGGRLPWRPAWLMADDGLAVRLLEAASLEWGAETTPTGRCLWASYRVRPEAEEQSHDD
jgi:hypothetical protein